METYDLAHVEAPAAGRVHAVLVHAPRNVAAVLDRVKRGDIPLPCAMLDARMLTSMEHVLVAVHQAVLRQARDSLKTKSIHSEIIWNLSASSNVMESFRTFGLSEQTQDAVLIHVEPRSETPLAEGAANVLNQLRALVDGEYDERGPSAALNAWRDGADRQVTLTDWDKVKRAYKLSDDEIQEDTDVDGEDGAKRQVLDIDDTAKRRRMYERIDALVTSTVAIKHVAS